MHGLNKANTSKKGENRHVSSSKVASSKDSPNLKVGDAPVGLSFAGKPSLEMELPIKYWSSE